MKLLEYQAKKILKESGIPIPRGFSIEVLSDLQKISYPAVLKAQVPVGGRGKAGGILKVNNEQEANEAANDLFLKSIKGYAVNTLLAETAHQIREEIYISCLHDKNKNRPMFMISREGGVNIETLAKQSPEKITVKYIDPAVGLMEYDIRGLALELGLKCDNSFMSLIRGMWKILRKGDATLVEINPLALTDEGLIALDAKVILDEKALYRHQEYQAFKAGFKGKNIKNISKPELLAEKHEISYVLLKGNIGIIADGAGTGMLTLDMVTDSGGRPANFCEMGGKAAEEAAEQAMDIVLANQNVTVLLISLIGGLTRMDRVAWGIDTFLKKNECKIPIAVRMCGTRAREGMEILAKHGIIAIEDLEDTVKAAVKMGEGAGHGHSD